MEIKVKEEIICAEMSHLKFILCLQRYIKFVDLQTI